MNPEVFIDVVADITKTKRGFDELKRVVGSLASDFNKLQRAAATADKQRNQNLKEQVARQKAEQREQRQIDAMYERSNRKQIAATRRAGAIHERVINRNIRDINREIAAADKRIRQNEKLVEHYRRQEIAAREARREVLLGLASLIGPRLTGAGFIGEDIIRSVVEGASTIERTTDSFTALLGSATAAADAIERIRNISLLPGIDESQARRSLQQLTAYKFAINEADLLTREFGNATALANGGAHALGEVLKQVAQASRRNKFEQQELNALIEYAPTLFQSYEKYLGDTITSGEDFTKATIAMSGSVKQFLLDATAFASNDAPRASVETLANAASNLRNQLNFARQELGKQFIPEIRAVTSVVSRLIEVFNDMPPAMQKMVGYTVLAGTALAKTGGALASFAGDMAIVIALLGGKGGAAFGRFTTLLAPIATGFRGITAAAGGLLPLLGKGGLVIGAIVAAGYAIHKLNEISKPTTAQLKVLSAAFEDVGQKTKTFREELQAVRGAIGEDADGFAEDLAQVIRVLDAFGGNIERLTQKQQAILRAGFPTMPGLLPAEEGDAKQRAENINRLVTDAQNRALAIQTANAEAEAKKRAQIQIGIDALVQDAQIAALRVRYQQEQAAAQRQIGINQLVLDAQNRALQVQLHAAQQAAQRRIGIEQLVLDAQNRALQVRYEREQAAAQRQIHINRLVLDAQNRALQAQLEREQRLTDARTRFDIENQQADGQRIDAAIAGIERLRQAEQDRQTAGSRAIAQRASQYQAYFGYINRLNYESTQLFLASIASVTTAVLKSIAIRKAAEAAASGNIVAAVGWGLGAVAADVVEARVTRGGSRQDAEPFVRRAQVFHSAQNDLVMEQHVARALGGQQAEHAMRQTQRRNVKDAATAAARGAATAAAANPANVEYLQPIINVYIGEDQMDATFETHYRRRELGLVVS